MTLCRTVERRMREYPRYNINRIAFTVKEEVRFIEL